MRSNHPPVERRGATVVEFALVAPVVLFVIFAQIVGGYGIFRYQEVAHLARDAARYASTHGGQYQLEHQTEIAAGTLPASISTSSQVLDYVKKRAFLLNPNYIQVNLSYTGPAGVSPPNMPYYVDPDPNQVPPGQNVIYNNVVVRVNYQWFPEMYLIGPITLSSTSEMPVSY